MLNKIINWSLQHRAAVIIAWAAMMTPPVPKQRPTSSRLIDNQTRFGAQAASSSAADRKK